MTPETVDAIKGALAPVAEKIGQGAEYGWAVVIKQMYVEAIGFFILSFFGLVMAVLGIFVAVAAYRYEKQNSWDDGKFGRGAVATALLMFGGFALSAGLVSGLGRIINPDFYALQFFIGLVK